MKVYACIPLKWQFGPVLGPILGRDGFGPKKIYVIATQGDEPAWHGYLYTAVLSVSAIFAAVCDSQYWYRMPQVGLGVRTALSSSIYRVL